MPFYVGTGTRDPTRLAPHDAHGAAVEIVLRRVPRSTTAPTRISLGMTWEWRDASIVQALCAPMLGTPLLHAHHQIMHEVLAHVIVPQAEHMNGAYAEHVCRVTPLLSHMSRSIAGMMMHASTSAGLGGSKQPVRAEEIARDLHMADRSVMPSTYFVLPRTYSHGGRRVGHMRPEDDLASLSTDATQILSPPHCHASAMPSSACPRTLARTSSGSTDIWATPCASPRMMTPYEHAYSDS